jgi:hypothetical protein
MSHIDTNLGNIFVKYVDNYHQTHYLTENLTFTTNKDHACKFYILKYGNTNIVNGDHITINSGHKTLVIDKANNIRLIDRDHTQQYKNSFIITNGSDNDEIISYETSVSFVTDNLEKYALKYHQNTICNNDLQVYPELVNSGYISETPELFHFYLEKINLSITNRVKTEAKNTSFLEDYKIGITVALLLVILVLLVLIQEY